jgi:hypothetical protein
MATNEVPEWCGSLANGGTGAQVNNIWNGVPNFYRNTGGVDDMAGYALLILGLDAVSIFNGDNPASFDWFVRQKDIQRWGDDPWRYRGGVAAAYPYVTNGPSGSSPAGYPERMWHEHKVALGYVYPWDATTPSPVGD